MKGFRSGPGRRQAARPVRDSTPPVKARRTTRHPDAELGRATRGLVGRGAGRATPTAGGGAGGVCRVAGLARLGLPRLGRIVTPARAAGLLGMLASGFLFSLATGPTAFGLTRTEIPPLAWTDGAAVGDALALPEGRNVFQLDTGPLEAALRALPGVAAAEVSVHLPDAAVVVRIEERRPVLAWQVRDRRFIADGEGVIFAEVDAAASVPAGVAVVDDRRQGAISLLSIGGRLDGVDLDVATRLGSLTPAHVGSTATELRVAVADDDGFIVSTPGGWTAVFGFYSAATRHTDMIPGQVRLLRSLLAGREAQVKRIILASETDGTYVPRTTPRPTRG